MRGTSITKAIYTGPISSLPFFLSSNMDLSLGKHLIMQWVGQRDQVNLLLPLKGLWLFIHTPNPAPVTDFSEGLRLLIRHFSLV